MVPDFQTLMLPALKLIADGQVHRAVPDIADRLADEFGLTTDEREQLLPSGAQPTIVNRTYWVFTYLAKAGLVERPARGRVRITDPGRAVLEQMPQRIDIGFLRQFPEFEAFRTKTASDDAPAAALPDQVASQNPEELLYRTYEALRRTVEAELLDRLQSEAFPWAAFESLVVELLGAMGYGSSLEDTSRRVTQRTGDDGIDGVIDQDRLGLDAVYIQAKKYGSGTVVGRPLLQAFAGSLEGQRATKGVFITTSRFSAEAEDYVKRISRRIVLIDGPTLARHMYDHDIGVRSSRRLDVKRVDEGFFEGEL